MDILYRGMGQTQHCGDVSQIYDDSWCYLSAHHSIAVNVNVACMA